VAKYCRAQQAEHGNMAHAHCMMDTCVQYTHLEYVILAASPLQQWLHELSSILRYTYIAGLVLRYRQQGEDLQRLPLKSSTDYLTFRGPCIVIYSYNKSQRDALFLKFI